MSATALSTPNFATPNGQATPNFPMPNPTANCQLPTVNCQRIARSGSSGERYLAIGSRDLSRVGHLALGVAWALGVAPLGIVKLFEHVFHVADECVLRQRTVAQPPADRGRQTPYGRRDVQLLAYDPQPGAGDLAAQPAHADELQQVVVFHLATTRRLDERILVGRLLQRPRRVAREQPE